MAKSRLAPAARDDIRDIRTYSISAFGMSRARDYIEGLRATLHRLGNMPRTGSIEHDLGANIRGTTYRSHRIYYPIAEDGVVIVRILHHSRDARTLLIGPA